VVPASQHFLKTIDDERHVNMDFRLLPYTVQTADTLFEQFGIYGQIEKNQVMRELEVTPFAADL